jgi:hypothetical protein
LLNFSKQSKYLLHPIPKALGIYLRLVTLISKGM